ncbi:MAG: hypothetical protein ABI165_02865 [Bryobacteraceae bacterium]
MTRRAWLGAGMAAPVLMAKAAPAGPCAPEAQRTKTAAIVTVYRYNSHADVLIGRLMAGYSANAVWSPSHTHVVSLHADQIPPATDMSRDLAVRNGFQLYPSIREALTLGGKSLAVDGVVFVGEHGDYPTNDVGQILYPRYELFNQILDVYEESGRSVPTFFDKHFSYSWEKADAIYRRAKKIGFPFMAGSSIPLTIRKPPAEPPLETPMTEAVMVGYGPADAYGFHTLEGLQCLVERRKGGETGIGSVQWIDGADIWAWRDSAEGAWSKPLLEEALRLQPLPASPPIEEQAKEPVLFVLNYRDGLKAAALVLTKNAAGFTAAIRVKGQKRFLTTLFGIGEPGLNGSAAVRPLPNWDGIGRCVDHFLGTGQPPNPVERTLLTTGALAFCFESKRQGKKRIETPELQVRYRGPVHSWFQTA